MSHGHLLLSAALALAALTACEAKHDAAPPPTASSPAASVAPAGPPSAQAALDAMDARKPVPLLPMMANHQKQNMRDHLVAVQEIVAALGTQDFAAIEESAGRIGYSEQMGQMCTHMGAGADGFTEQALAFHHTADGIGEAAKRKDADGVLKALNQTLAACTGCHATYKQAVVDEATWTATTKMAPPMHSP